MRLNGIASRITVALFAAAAAGQASAETPAEFYQGKTVTIIVGAGAGGGYTFYARLLAEFIERRLPGAPNIIIQNMPGAGGIKAANFVANVAPTDGSTLGFLLKHTPMAQVLGSKGVKYDAAAFRWIGNMDENQGVISVLKTAPATTIEQAKTTELILASTGRGSETYINPAVMNHTLGTKFKIVTGYKGASDMDLAIERGEAHGRGCAWAGWKILKPDWIAEGRLVNLVQVGLQKDTDLPNVPLLGDLAETEEQRQIFNFLALPNVMARSLFAPAGTPPDRVAALRAAFDQTVTDPAFLAEAAKRKISISPRSGAEVQRLVKKLIDTPRPIVDTVRSALGLRDRAGIELLPAAAFSYAGSSCVFAGSQG